MLLHFEQSLFYSPLFKKKNRGRLEQKFREKDDHIAGFYDICNRNLKTIFVRK